MATFSVSNQLLFLFLQQFDLFLDLEYFHFSFLLVFLLYFDFLKVLFQLLVEKAGLRNFFIFVLHILFLIVIFLRLLEFLLAPLQCPRVPAPPVWFADALGLVTNLIVMLLRTFNLCNLVREATGVEILFVPLIFLLSLIAIVEHLWFVRDVRFFWVHLHVFSRPILRNSLFQVLDRRPITFLITIGLIIRIIHTRLDTIAILDRFNSFLQLLTQALTDATGWELFVQWLWCSECFIMSLLLELLYNFKFEVFLDLLILLEAWWLPLLLQFVEVYFAEIRLTSWSHSLRFRQISTLKIELILLDVWYILKATLLSVSLLTSTKLLLEVFVRSFDFLLFWSRFDIITVFFLISILFKFLWSNFLI